MVELKTAEIIENANRYDLVTMSSLIESSKLYNKMELEQMSFESRWLLESLECGFILPVTEAETTGSDIMNAIKEWITKMVAKIKADSVKRAEKYIPWINDNKEALVKAAASKKDGIKMTPYYDGQWNKDPQTIASMLSKGIQNLENQKYDDFSWANPITDAKNVETRDKNLTNYLKNYFRFNMKDTLDVKSVTLSPSDIAGRIEEFISYISNYGKTIPNNVDRIFKAYDTKRVEKILAVKESMTTNSYLTIENCLVCETALSNLLNYDSFLLEADEKDDDKKADAVKVDNKEGESVTAVSSEGEVDKKKEDNKTEDGEKKETNPNKANYAKSLEYFFKLVTIQYASACDERFLVYLNVLKEVAKSGDVPLPKFDDAGNYIKVTKTEETPKKEDK